MTELLARLLIVLAIVVAAISAPRPAPESTASLPPVDVSRAEADASIPGPIGAPQVRTPQGVVDPSQRPDGGGAPSPMAIGRRIIPRTIPSPRPTVRPTTRPTARPTARPTIQAIARPVAQATPRASHVNAGLNTLAGRASWYGTGGPGMYAAMHAYVDGTHVQVVVCAFPAGQATCITVPVVTQCGACRWAAGAVLVDLSVPAFRALGVPLSVGHAKVTVQVLR